MAALTRSVKGHLVANSYENEMVERILRWKCDQKLSPVKSGLPLRLALEKHRSIGHLASTFTVKLECTKSPQIALAVMACDLCPQKAIAFRRTFLQHAW